MRITFRAQGVPVPQCRPKFRVIRSRKGSFASAYYPDPNNRRKAWLQCLQSAALAFRPASPLQGPIRCDVELVLPRPRSHYGSGSRSDDLKATSPVWHTTGAGKMGGDRDNFDKIILDAMTKLGMWQDDGQICDGRIRKRYAGADGWTGAIITIRTLDNTAPLPLETASDACDI